MKKLLVFLYFKTKKNKLLSFVSHFNVFYVFSQSPTQDRLSKYLAKLMNVYEMNEHKAVISTCQFLVQYGKEKSNWWP